jgi:beta-phosphoglucomutase-like phosphatase (HAD superfamily)
MPDAILWDMDGTLVDTERVAWDAMRAAFADAAGIDLPEPLFASLMGRSESDFYAAMQQHFGLVPDVLAAIEDAFDAGYMPLLARVPPLPGAVEKVREFARYAPQALVTGSTTEQARTVLDSLGIADEFRAVIGCDQYSAGKPDPQPFLQAARTLGVPPYRCLCIEDSPSGVKAALAAGMKVVGVHAGNGGRYDISASHLELPDLPALDWNALRRALFAQA